MCRQRRTVLLHGLPLQRLRKKYPEWFQTDIAQRKNLLIIAEPLSAEAVAALLARSGVHLCPSAREGFGHYINEARAASALVVRASVLRMLLPVVPFAHFSSNASKHAAQLLHFCRCCVAKS